MLGKCRVVAVVHFRKQTGSNNTVDSSRRVSGVKFGLGSRASRWRFAFPAKHETRLDFRCSPSRTRSRYCINLPYLTFYLTFSSDAFATPIADHPVLHFGLAILPKIAIHNDDDHDAKLMSVLSEFKLSLLRHGVAYQKLFRSGSQGKGR